MNLSNPPNTSATPCASSNSLSGFWINALIFVMLSGTRNLSDSWGCVWKTLFTKPHCTSSSHVMRLLMISASLAFAIPNLRTKLRDARPSATKPRELKGSGREPDGWTIESSYKDLGVRVEGLSGIKVVGGKGGQPLLVWILAGCAGPGDAHICSSVRKVNFQKLQHRIESKSVTYALKNLPFPVKTVIIELVGDIEGNDCDLATGLKEDGFFGARVGGHCLRSYLMAKQQQ
ncbi:hypothetical protein KC367_g239 [Hortaea werneckii]|nr:hypothetical protein KC367_g239 [Hortaea werneckii]